MYAFMYAPQEYNIMLFAHKRAHYTCVVCSRA